jgi:hypothetical protein
MIMTDPILLIVSFVVFAFLVVAWVALPSVAIDK